MFLPETARREWKQGRIGTVFYKVYALVQPLSPSTTSTTNKADTTLTSGQI